MSATRIVLTLVLGWAMVGCSFFDPYSESFYDREDRTILPSEEPLVLALFERRLNEEGIAYKRDFEGYYAATDADNAGRLLSIGKKLRKKHLPHESLEIGKDCASRKLQGYLRGEGVLFALEKEEDKHKLLFNPEEVSAEDMQARLSQFQQECASE